MRLNNKILVLGVKKAKQKTTMKIAFILTKIINKKIVETKTCVFIFDQNI